MQVRGDEWRRAAGVGGFKPKAGVHRWLAVPQMPPDFYMLVYCGARVRAVAHAREPLTNRSQPASCECRRAHREITYAETVTTIGQVRQARKIQVFSFVLPVFFFCIAKDWLVAIACLLP
jgi:hypothetical protein